MGKVRVLPFFTVLFFHAPEFAVSQLTRAWSASAYAMTVNIAAPSV